jgi:hypothetical protein
MTRKCTPLYNLVVNGNITFWERRQSSTLITSLCSSYKQGKLQNDHHQKWSTYLQQFHINIKYKKGRKIVSLTSSIDLSWLHSPLWSIPVGMMNLIGPNFINKIRTFPRPISSWVQAQMSLIFTFRTNCYAIWAMFVFLQVRMQR